jgi:hypothetical protein
MQHGFSVSEACALDPILRQGFIYIFHQQKGGKVDWDTGEVFYE